MKIIMSGIEGSDKKSLAEELAKNLSIELVNLNFQNVTGSYVQMLKSPNAQAAADARRQHVMACLAWINEFDKKLAETDGIYLRSPLDILSLWLKSGIGLQRPEVFIKVLDKCQEQVAKADHLVLCPAYSYDFSKPFAGQEIPSTQETHHKLNFQCLNIGLANEFAADKTITIPNNLSSLEERSSFVLDKINSAKTEESKPKNKTKK